MSAKEITISAVFKTTKEQLYCDWLSSEGHTSFTGGEAVTSEEAGAPFTAWDGYIEGVNLELNKDEKILQSWRTMEFDKEDSDSQIEILLEPESGGVKFTLTHSNIPDGDEEKYKQGWQEHYITPMSKYYA